MTAVRSLPAFLAHSDTSSPITIPAELLSLFEESAKAKASFLRLPVRDRRGFVRYIDEDKPTTTRARRAAIIAKTLIGLAPDLKDDPR